MYLYFIVIHQSFVIIFSSNRKSVEEAGRSVEKTHRRLTTHLNKTDTVTEEEETGSDTNEIDKQEQNLFPQKRKPLLIIFMVDESYIRKFKKL